MTVKEHFINSSVIEMNWNWDWKDVRGWDRDTGVSGTRIRVGRTGTGMIHVTKKSWNLRNTNFDSYENVPVCAFSNCLSAFLPDITFHDVILFEDGSDYFITRNSNFYDSTRDLRTGHYFGEHCFNKQISYRTYHMRISSFANILIGESCWESLCSKHFLFCLENWYNFDNFNNNN